MHQARACALRDAEKQLWRHVGCAEPIRIPGRYVKDEYSEQRRGSGAVVRDFWVLVAYPRREIRQAQARVAERVLLGVHCNADPSSACEPGYAARLEQAMTRAGMQPAPERLSASASARLEHALRVAERQQAARVLLTTAEARFLSSMDGEFYAQARCGFRLIDAVDGKVLSTFDSGPVKGGHLSKQAAVRKALDTCIDRAAERVMAIAPR